jgi:hypothetical protein
MRQPMYSGAFKREQRRRDRRQEQVYVRGRLKKRAGNDQLAGQLERALREADRRIASRPSR